MVQRDEKRKKMPCPKNFFIKTMNKLFRDIAQYVLVSCYMLVWYVFYLSIIFKTLFPTVIYINLLHFHSTQKKWCCCCEKKQDEKSRVASKLVDIIYFFSKHLLKSNNVSWRTQFDPLSISSIICLFLFPLPSLSFQDVEYSVSDTYGTSVLILNTITSDISEESFVLSLAIATEAYA